MSIVLIEILAVVFGVIHGVTAMLNKRINWYAYAMQMICMVILSFGFSLYGDTVHNLIYIPICILAWFLWRPNGFSGSISRLSKTCKIIAVSGITVLSIAIWVWLKDTDDPVPELDAFTTALTIIGIGMLMMRKAEAWILWIINYIATIIQYILIPERPVLLISLNVVLIILAYFSYKKWLKIFNGELSEWNNDTICSTGHGFCL